MTGRGRLDRPAGLSRCPSSTGSRRAPPPSVVGGPDRAPHGPGDVVADLFGRGGWVARRRRRPPAPGRLARIEPADPDARRGRPAPARRPPPRRRVPGPGRLAAPRVEPQGLDRRPVRDALRDVRPDARRRRDHLVGRRRGGRSPAGPRPVARALPLHGLPRPARRLASSARRRSMPTTSRRATRRRRRRRDARRRCSAASRRSPAPRACPTSCSTCTRRASSSGSARSSNGSRATCAPAPVLAALRLALLHAILPASRLHRARAGRDAAGRRRATSELPTGDPVARAQPVARVRGRLPAGPRVRPAARGRRARADPGPPRRGPAQPRRGHRDGRRSALSAPSRAARPARRSATPTAGAAPTPRIRLVLGQPPLRPEPRAPRRRLSRHVLGARPRGGRAPADRRPRRCLAARRRGAGRRPRSPARSRRSSRSMARDGRVVQLVDGGPEALVAVVARRRGGRLPPGRRPPGRCRRRRGRRSSSSLPPGAAPAARRRGPAPTSRSTPVPGGAGRPGRRPAAAACSRRRSGSTSGRSPRPRRARTVTETAVETLRARGEPARFERLLGEILVGLDRAGQLRRLADRRRSTSADREPSRRPGDGRPGRPAPDGRRPGDRRRRGRRLRRAPDGATRPRGGHRAGAAPTPARVATGDGRRRTRSSACSR